ncbi:MAG: hypothetical protein Q9183_003598, partial [Haloplaca sp. 2 TL-2023]
MATVMASKPPPPHQKIKRPPPPAVQTNVNGVKSSQSSPSPSLGSKRPPSAFKQPSNHGAPNVNGMNGIVSGSSTARSTNRRRDSQKPGDTSARQNRPGKNAQGDNSLDRRKKMAEPYVKTPGYILKKYKNKPPSLILHLHATHFRFDQQDGSFSYKTPMRIILEHLRTQTVPHDMIEELNNAGVKFYEGCLIVQVQDHRSIAADSRTSSSATANESNKPFSVHNYNEHVTPSPFVPYPKRALNSGLSDGDKTKDESSTNAPNTSQKDVTTSKTAAKGPKVFTQVLLPTPQSFEEEVFLWASTPDPRANNRKQSQASSAGKTPASATMAHPPTPLSAISSTSSSGPPAKKQKMILGESDIRNFQSKLTTASAAPLFLDPVDSLQEATRLINGLTDSMHKKGYPLPKTRKRTVAELEADEAQAASEERFMLVMDERLGVSDPTVKAGGGDGEAGAAAFEPRFERFKTIENIKAQQREKEQQAQEQRAINQANQQAANKAKQDQMEQHRLVQEKKNADMATREQSMRVLQARQNAQNEQQLRAALSAQQMNGNSNIQSHGPSINGIVSNQQQLPQNAQTQHSSPISRHMTPHSNPRSSPLVGNVPHAIPMNVTASNQGVTSSPARPTSAAQTGHPGGIGMVRNLSQQRPPSRMGTPSMAQHGTPVIKQGTPTPRLNQGSPPNGIMHTPVMNGNGAGFHHMGGQQVTPEQVALERSRQHQQALFNQRQLAAGQGQASNGPTANGMSPMHMPGNANHQNASLQHLAAHNHSQQQSLRAYQAQQQEYVQHRLQNSPMNNNPNAPPSFVPNSSPPNPHNRPMPPQPAQHRPQQMQMNQALQQQLKQLQQQALNNFFSQLVQTYGSVEAIPPEKQAEARQQAVVAARRVMGQRQRQQMQNMAAASAGQGQGGQQGM